MKDKKHLVPYELLSPGYEAVYTGEKSAVPLQDEGWPISRFTDSQGNIYERWSVWTWVPMNGEVTCPEERTAIDRMQTALGPLDEETRRIRAQIGSLVLCDPGIPVTIDALLSAIGRGRLGEPSFHSGCWLSSMGWESQGTQPRYVESFQVIESCLVAYLQGEPLEALTARYPQAAGFLRRIFAWLGPRPALTELQKLMLERMLLPFDYFTKRRSDYEAGERDCFGAGGRGEQLDECIAQRSGLPKIYANYKPEFRQNLQSIPEPEKQELYRICGALTHSLHGLSDCHHSMYRWIENWIYAIGKGRWEKPDRKHGVERERLARLLFGYSLGLDRWLMGVPELFLLLDLSYADLGFDPKNEIVRVYAYLGEEKTPVKEWLAACLWHNLSGGGNPSGLIIQQELNAQALSLGISTRTWMDGVLARIG
jgi:hypothetical protein